MTENDYSPRTWEWLGPTVDTHVSSEIVLTNKGGATNDVSVLAKRYSHEYSPVVGSAHERLVFEVGLDVRVDSTLPREMPLASFDQTLESLDRLASHAPIESQEGSVKLFEELPWETGDVVWVRSRGGGADLRSRRLDHKLGLGARWKDGAGERSLHGDSSQIRTESERLRLGFDRLIVLVLRLVVLVDLS